MNNLTFTKLFRLSALLALQTLLLLVTINHAGAQTTPPTAPDYQLQLMPIHQEDYIPILHDTLTNWQRDGLISQFELIPAADLLRVTADPAFRQRWQLLPGVIALLEPALYTASLTPQPPGAISGQVTAADSGSPLANIRVCVNGDTTYYYACATTDSTGNYIFNNLPVENYRINYWDTAYTYATEYYNHQPDWSSATLVTVAAGTTTSGINAVLSRTGNITGVVTAPDGVTPLSNISVAAYRYNSSGSYWSSVSWAETDAAGAYTLTGLAPDVYRIRIQGDAAGLYHAEWYNNAADEDSAADVTVNAGATTANINVSLEWAGHISGVVTGPDGVTPLSGIRVTVFWYDSNVGGHSLNSVSTDALGAYDIGGLSSDVYRLEFDDSSGRYWAEWYNNAADIYSSTEISVTAGATTAGINASLAAAGQIAGQVTTADGVTPLEDAQITVYSLGLTRES